MNPMILKFINYCTAKLPLVFIPFGIGLLIGEMIIPNVFSGLSSQKRFVFISPFIGWAIAFCAVIMQIIYNRKHNDELKKIEIKKTLQIEAFKQINLSISECSRIYTDIFIAYNMLPAKLKTYSQNTNFDFFSFILPFSNRHYQIDLHKGHAIFKRAIEANEIAIIEFKHLDTFIFLEIHSLSNLIDKFIDYIARQSQQSLLHENNKEFDLKSNEIAEMVMDIQSYLYDFRITLMNHFYEDIFNKRVPNRNPNNKNHKILNELAKNKEEVEKEFKELEKSLSFSCNKGGQK